MIRSNLPRLPLLAAAMFGAAGAAHAQAYLTQSINTTSLNTASWDTASTTVGPWPFSNFGVQGSASLGLMASASTSGSTTFQAPKFTPGQILCRRLVYQLCVHPELDRWLDWLERGPERLGKFQLLARSVFRQQIDFRCSA